MYEMITQGISAHAIDTRTAKSRACPEATRLSKTYMIGNGAVDTLN